jgi:glucose-6-phosphate 1-dehydrogenase
MARQEADKNPIAMVIFGATGDLTHRKLMPALYNILCKGHMPAKIQIIGFARRPYSDRDFQQEMKTAVEKALDGKSVDETVLSRLLEKICYISSTFEDAQGYQKLAEVLKGMGSVNRLFYLATPPEEYQAIIRQIGKANLANCPDGWTRIVVEKPYGHNLQSAEALDTEIHKVFKENQIYRIDHYLGKETVQNILVFRFANGIFEPLWNRRYVDHVQIRVAETVGVGTRAGYYEEAGVSRDIFQNHMMQLLCLTAMEAPWAFNADAVRDEKIKVLHSLRPMIGKQALENTFRAQYTAGEENGKPVVGYREEKGVDPDSITETLMAARLYVDNWRWSGVPFYVRSGKRLKKRITEIMIQFKQAPLSLFGGRSMAEEAPDRLYLNIQPDEGITLTFGAKAPGPVTRVVPVEMEFNYAAAFGGEPPEAYERLLVDAMEGDATLFTRSDEVLAAWRITTEILKAWASEKRKSLPGYAAGTWGPKGIDEFIQRDGRSWHVHL